MSVALDRQRILACLSDPSRFSLVTTLAAGPRCVTELAGLVGLSQSCTTRHLQALLRAGIVTGRREGKRVMYALHLDAGPAQPVLEWVFAVELDGTEGGRRRRTRLAGGARLERPARREAEPKTELEPDLPALHAGVEHESGWVAADRAADADLLAGDSLDDEVSHDAEADEPRRGGVRPAPHRADMDDFLL